MQIGVTGSSGFIGRELVDYFLSKGDTVVMLQRKQPAAIPTHAQYRYFDLNDNGSFPDVSSLDALIHTAYVPYAKNNSSEINTQGTLRLSELCKQAGVPFIFLSSMSAHAGALSEYGKHKYALEQQLDQSSVLILKLGLVLGWQGLFSRIKKTVEKSALIPLIGGGMQPVQTVYLPDLLRVLSRCIETKQTGLFSIATPTVYPMSAVFKTIAACAHKKPIFIPLPYWMVETGIGLIEWLRIPFPVSRENLYGLKQLRAFDTQKDLDRLGIQLLDMPQSVQQLSEA